MSWSFFAGNRTFATMFHEVTNKPLTLSIIIPAYNEERHLPACLDAIRAQTVQPDEVLLIDNNSTDNTTQIARTYPFVRVVQERKQGIIFARNKGFDSTKCDIIARIDADTILPEHWVHAVRQFYADGKHADYALTGGGFFYNLRLPRFNGWMQSQLAFRVNRWVVGHYILWGSNMAFLRTQWAAVRKSVCMRNDIHEDIDLAIHLHNHGYKIRYEAKDLRVGVYMKRFWNDRHKMREHMRRWPESLRVHGYSKWWFGVVGNMFLWIIGGPLLLFLEFSARLFGKKSITHGQNGRDLLKIRK